jgi:large subunit ribosomal protein L14
MFQNESVLLVADNSGAKEVLVISNYRSRIGDLVTATVKKAEPNKFTKKEEKIVRALIITSKKGFQRADGSFISFSKNYAVLFKRKKKEKGTILKRKEKPELLGTRILVPVLREFEE